MTKKKRQPKPNANVSNNSTKKNPVIKSNVIEEVADRDSDFIPTLPTIPTGLKNHGNTCFFNSVIQCLRQTPYLLHLLHETSQSGQQFKLPGGKLTNKQTSVVMKPLKGTLEIWGPLMQALATTLQQLSEKAGVLFSKFGVKRPQFTDGEQHDSHELLRHLLEVVREEDLARYQKVIFEKTGPSDKKSHKFYSSQVSELALTIDQVFRGVLVSILQCQECKHTSYCNEFFLDISLPVSCEDDSTSAKVLSKKELRSEKKKKKKELKINNKALVKSHSNETLSSENKENSTCDSPEKCGDEIEVQASFSCPISNDLDIKMVTPTSDVSKRSNQNEESDPRSTTLKPRYQSKQGESSIQSCLNQFTVCELLTGNDKVACDECSKKGGDDEKVFTNAKKQFLVCNPPAVLILHLNRFQVSECSPTKFEDFVSFPILLDLAPFCCRSSEKGEVFYSLYGVVVHEGCMESGHYISYVKCREENPIRHFLPKNQKQNKYSSECQDENVNPQVPVGSWYYISDSYVSEVPEDEVLRAEAYILFYERVM